MTHCPAFRTGLTLCGANVCQVKIADGHDHPTCPTCRKLDDERIAEVAPPLGDEFFSNAVLTRPGEKLIKDD